MTAKVPADKFLPKAIEIVNREGAAGMRIMSPYSPYSPLPVLVFQMLPRSKTTTVAG